MDRVPTAARAPFVHGDRQTLHAAIEVHKPEAAIEISRLRAIGLMLRNCTPVFILGCALSAVEIGVSNAPGFAAMCLGLLILAAAGSFMQSLRLIHWANLRTLEVAFWIPGVNESLRPLSDIGGTQRKVADC